MKKTFDLHDYSDIIDLPYPNFSGRRKMSMTERGAQFSPFAALTGYDDAIEETARLTEPQKLLSEEERENIDRVLCRLEDPRDCERLITVLYFLPDARKEGGSYLRCSGYVKRIDEQERRLLMQDGLVIPIDAILDLQFADESTFGG